MKRTSIAALMVSVSLLTLAPGVRADGRLSMRLVDCYRLAELPAMKLVVRDQSTLVKMGITEMVDIDFSKEMGLFISLGPEKGNLEAIRIKAVNETDGKITVETQHYGFEALLNSTAKEPLLSYQFVVVPARKAPVEGFKSDIEPCEGLCAVSSLVPMNQVVSHNRLKERGKARDYRVTKVEEVNPMIKRLDWAESVAWYVGPKGDPKGIVCRLNTVKSGGGAQCQLEYHRGRYAPPSRARLREMTHRQIKTFKCPASLDLLAEGLRAAFGVQIAVSEDAAKQIHYGYVFKASNDEGMTDIAAIRKSEVRAERFRRYIDSDGKTFVCGDTGFLDTLDEVGKKGSIRWRKPYLKAYKEIEDLGRVTLACNELKLFQIRIECVKTTDVEELRKQTRRLARRVGIRLGDEALEAVTFSFRVKR
jgi:hypothetical protein